MILHIVGRIQSILRLASCIGRVRFELNSDSSLKELLKLGFIHLVELKDAEKHPKSDVFLLLQSWFG